MLLGGIEVMINHKTIGVSDVCSWKDVRICDNLVPGYIIVRENHSHSPSQSSFLTFVDPSVISAKTHQQFPFRLFRIQ
ncbi:hypothetical protein Hanom_Chr12g01116341 [Helianthus anomalus]